MYIFEAKIKTLGKKNLKTRTIEIEGFYDLSDAWHYAAEEAIKSLSDNERFEKLEIIAY